MPNFLESLGKGFTRHIPNIADILSQGIFRNAELEKEETEKQRKLREERRIAFKNRDIISQLNRGTQTVGGDVTQGFLPEFQVPLNQQQQQNLFAQLPKDARADFIAGEKFAERFEPEEPTKQQTFSFGGKVFPYILNPETNQLEVDFDNPLAEEEEDEVTFVPANTIKGLENFRGFTQKLVNGKPSGQPFKPTRVTGGGDDGVTIDDIKTQTLTWENILRLRGEDVKKYDKLVGLEDRDLIGTSALINAREIHNDNMFRLEQEIFNELLPEAKKEVNEFFTGLKTQFPEGVIDDREAFLRSPQLKQRFNEGVTEAYKDGEYSDLTDIDTRGLDKDEIKELQDGINAQVYRQLLSWSGAKFNVILPRNFSTLTEQEKSKFIKERDARRETQSK